jgi:hypothetical protein
MAYKLYHESKHSKLLVDRVDLTPGRRIVSQMVGDISSGRAEKHSIGDNGLYLQVSHSSLFMNHCAGCVPSIIHASYFLIHFAKLPRGSVGSNIMMSTLRAYHTLRIVFQMKASRVFVLLYMVARPSIDETDQV